MTAARTLTGAERSLDDLDLELRHLVRGEAQLRLRIGTMLHALFRTGGHRELGFSSIDAYVEERCGQSRWWGRDTRALARRLEEKGLTQVRAALRAGRIPWTMADLLSRHASAADERFWIDEAASETLRSMQARLTQKTGRVQRPLDESFARPTRWLSVNELRMLALSRLLVDYLSGGSASDEMLMTALLGEAETSLQSLVGWEAPAGEQAGAEPRALEARLALAREAFRRLVEPAGSRAASVAEDSARTSRCTSEPLAVPVVPEAPLPSGALALDRAIAESCRRLAERAVRMGELARRVITARMWRRRGYASPSAYAEQHLGLSLSTLEHHATLARRLARHPELREALCEGVIGAEAAQLVGRVLGKASDPALVIAWVSRAGARTYKHLREEVNAVLLGASLDPTVSRMPPSDDELQTLAALERRVQSGEVFRSLLGAHTPGPQTFVTLASASDTAAGVRPLNLTLPTELHRYWLDLEARFHDLAGRQSSFVAFMCTSLWSTWLPYLESRSDKWGEVYRRDRHRCSNPVCSRRDLTPHHVVFQSHGGGDELENMVTLCSWCHLDGVHRGRVAVRREGRELGWRVGPPGFLRVEGRTVVTRG